MLVSASFDSIVHYLKSAWVEEVISVFHGKYHVMFIVWVKIPELQLLNSNNMSKAKALKL